MFTAFFLRSAVAMIWLSCLPIAILSAAARVFGAITSLICCAGCILPRGLSANRPLFLWIFLVALLCTLPAVAAAPPETSGPLSRGLSPAEIAAALTAGSAVRSVATPCRRRLGHIPSPADTGHHAIPLATDLLRPRPQAASSADPPLPGSSRISLADTVPVTSYQASCLGLQSCLPSHGFGYDPDLDWLDNDLCSLVESGRVKEPVLGAVLRTVCWHDAGQPAPDSLAIYTDGSAPRDPLDPSPCAWSFNVWALCGGARYFVGHSEAVATHLGTPWYLGECRHDALTAELMALCWALAWLIEVGHRFAVPEVVLLDPPNRLWEQIKNTNSFPVLRVLCGILPQRFFRYITSSLGNELADLFSKWVRCLSDDPWQRCLPQWVSAFAAHDLRQWAWTFFCSGPDMLSCYTFESEARRLQSHRALPAVAPMQGIRTTTRPAEDVRCDLRVVSFNVLTMRDPTLPGHGAVTTTLSNDVGFRLFGRKHVLQRSLEEYSPNIVGFQETRLPDDITQHDDSYYIFQSRANDQGVGGCALWLSRRIPYATQGSESLVFHPSHVTVVGFSYRHLIVQISAPRLQLMVAVLHAPSLSKHPYAEVSSFWDQRCREISRRPDGSDFLILVDANARLGSAVSDSVGDHDGEEEQEAGSLFHTFVIQLGGYVPATFSAHHQGPSTTWRSALGGRHRIDYIVTPQAWSTYGLTTSVLQNFEALQLREDHKPVALSCAFGYKGKPTSYTDSRRRAIRPGLPRTTTESARVSGAFAHIPCLPWSLDVDLHCQVLSQSWCAAGTQLLDDAAIAPRAPYVPPEALPIIQRRRALCVYLRQEEKETCRRRLLIGFAAFRLACSGGRFTAAARATADHWIAAMDHSIAVAWAYFRDHGLQLRRLAAIRRAFPAARSAKRSGTCPLPALELPSGELATTASERAACWRNHFADQEAGVEVTPSEYVAAFQQYHRPCEHFVFDASVLPGLLQTESIILSLKNGKACGPDGVTAEILKLRPALSARELLPLMLKSSLSIREPVAWRGGDLVLVAKKAGVALTCSHYRSVLVANVMGKVYHRGIRSHLTPLLEESQPPLMAGATAGAGIEIPVLAIKSFQLLMGAQRRPWAVVFFDLQTAYYAVLRQTIAGNVESDASLLQLLHKLRLPPQALTELKDKLHLLAELPTLGASEHLHSLVRDLFTGTWFRVSGDAVLTLTKRGSRPGDPLADALFAVTLSAYLKSVSQALGEADMLPDLPHCRNRPLWADDDSASCLGSPAWADDFTLPQTGTSHTDLVVRVARCTQLVVTHGRSLGMTIKFGVDKTAALCCSSVERFAMPQFQVNDEGLHLLPALFICLSYRHLGGIVVSNCATAPDLHFRYSRAAGLARSLRRRLFSSPAFDLATRRVLLRSLVVSKFVHTSASLVLRTAESNRLWERYYVALLRNLLKRVSAEKQAHSYEVLRTARAASPPLALAKARAQFLVRLFRNGPLALRVFLHDHWVTHPASSWLGQLESDVRCVGAFVPTALTFFRPQHLVADLLEATFERPKWWLQQVTAAERAFLLDLEAWRVQRLHSVADRRPTVPRPFICDTCGDGFVLRKHLHAHMARSHRQFAPARHYAVSDTCISCIKWFRNVTQVQMHLRHAPECLRRASRLIPPLSIEDVRRLEAPDKQRQKLIAAGRWQAFQALPGPRPAPVTFGPRLPTAAERRPDNYLSEDVDLASLVVRFEPRESDIAWVDRHIASASVEGVRESACRFWLKKPSLSHQNS
ncbi:unnamed protein product [Symbiodinium sp. CCMP2592]|nr:unnamed protein product [Symbiodinium sp. CCMP2592]